MLVSMRIHAYICMHVCTYIYMSLPVNIRAYIHVHVCAHVCVMMRICVCVSICEHAFVVCPCSPSCFACVCLTPPSSFLCILGLSDPLTNSPPNPPPLLRVLIFHLNNMVLILPFSKEDVKASPPSLCMYPRRACIIVPCVVCMPVLWQTKTCDGWLACNSLVMSV